MKCPECDGTGKVDGWDGWTEYSCKVCDGKGYLNEQEYIQTCNTEQLAEVLFSWYKLGRLDVINKHTELKKDWLIGWLKQPHNSPK